MERFFTGSAREEVRVTRGISRFHPGGGGWSRILCGGDILREEWMSPPFGEIRDNREEERQRIILKAT